MAHDDVIQWKYFPRDWPFVRGIHRSPVNSPHKGQWRRALMFSLICVWFYWLWFETPSWSLWRQCNECVFYGISHGHYTVISHQLWNTIHLLERYRIANRNHYNIDNTGLVNRYYRKLIRTLSAKHGVHIFAMAEWTYFCGMYVLKAYLGYILTISLVLYNMIHPI